MDMNAANFESLLEGMLQLSLNSPQDSDGVTVHLDGVAEQLVAAQPAAAAENGEREQQGQSAGEWAKILVSQMGSATTVEDAHCRAAKVLEAFGGTVCSRAAQVVADKDRVLGTAVRLNATLKKAVVAQYRRQLEYEAKGRELQAQISRLEADKYVLSMHLRNAGPAGSSMPGNFPPEVC
ncbi:unnamed protein product [Alopecurus aequalis]